MTRRKGGRMELDSCGMACEQKKDGGSYHHKTNE
jgi:hypothetical protein